MNFPALIPIFAYFALILPSVTAHGYIKLWSADGEEFQKAQKQPLSETSFRSAPTNTGWIGSHYIDSAAFTCGSADTPQGKTAPPGGNLFSKPEQSAKKTLSTKPGGTISLIVAGNHGEGFPHPEGHVQSFLGHCGSSPNACQDFDAAKPSYHRIQAELHGIPNKLRKQFEPKYDGNKWEVTIPEETPDGSYILRTEMVAFDQSGKEEGHQDQYYVFCGQIHVNGSKASSTGLGRYPSVKFPGAYKTGNIDHNTLPGPLGSASVSDSDSSISTSSDHESKLNSKSNNKLKSLSEDKNNDEKTADKGNDEKTSDKGNEGKTADKANDEKTADKGADEKNADKENAQKTSDSATSTAPACADRCYKKKLTELTSLAPSCSEDQFDCLCRTANFVKAYENCCKDHCQGDQETKSAIEEIHEKCASVTAPESKKSSLRTRNVIHLATSPGYSIGNSA